ncbi:MAG TPA: threonine--tRNA ligase, partial [Polyangiaceae bacterium]|nr:threonine--tRNA ligase [Polyangiaceae bacterium]
EETIMDILDHKQLGQKLGLFHLQKEAPGMVFWHPAGFVLVRAMEGAIRRRLVTDGFVEVLTPQLVRRRVWEASGHWENFRAHMFSFGDQGREEALKPVSCPCHVQIVERMAPSYRDLPIRLAEFGVVHRDEDDGALNGLFRLRQFTQDDGHIFCEKAQIEDEVVRFCTSVRALYEAFGFASFSVSLSTRPAQRTGDDAMWDVAERVLDAAARSAGLEPSLQPGEGAFYGPKLEFSLQDRLDRSWQCGTIQLDFAMPERFGLSYVDSQGAKARPVMLHRAILGSIERFLAVLLEHHQRALPPWLAPEQIRVLPISDAQAAYAKALRETLQRRGLRATVAARGQTLSRAIVDAHDACVPFLAVVGKREAVASQVTLRHRDGQQRVIEQGAAAAELAAVCTPPL